MLAAGKPVLITDGLAERLDGVNLDVENLAILKVKGKPRGLLKLTREQINPIRNKLLNPLGIKFDAPNKVALYLIGEHCFVVENFNDESVDVAISFSKPVRAQRFWVMPNDGSLRVMQSSVKLSLLEISPRSLVVIEY
jgi:hypothetical protein